MIQWHYFIQWESTAPIGLARDEVIMIGEGSLFIDYRQFPAVRLVFSTRYGYTSAVFQNGSRSKIIHC